MYIRKTPYISNCKEQQQNKQTKKINDLRVGDCGQLSFFYLQVFLLPCVNDVKELFPSFKHSHFRNSKRIIQVKHQRMSSNRILLRATEIKCHANNGQNNADIK